MINKRYCDDQSWFRCIRDGWGDPHLVAYPQRSDKELTRAPVVTMGTNKDVVCMAHVDMLETWTGDPGMILYTDGSKNSSAGKASVAWVFFKGGMAGAPYDISVPPSSSIVECELFEMLGGLRSLPITYTGTVAVYSDCVPALWMMDAMKPLGDSAGLWDMFVPELNRFKSVSMSWVPGHRGIRGNEVAAIAARRAITPLETWK